MSTIQNRLAGLYQKQQLLGILVFSMVTIVAWVAISLISSQTKTALSPELQKLATPLTPTLNHEVLDTIEAKRVYGDEDLASFPIYKILVNTRNRAPAVASPSGIGDTRLGNLTGVDLAPEPTPEAASSSSNIDDGTEPLPFSQSETPNNLDDTREFDPESQQ